jgi:hypothetical protein
MKRILRKSLIIAFAICFVFVSIISVIIIRKGYDFQEMDWNGDGNTSLREFFKSIDVGKRYVVLDNYTCVEYYTYKDLRPIKRICNDKTVINPWETDLKELEGHKYKIIKKAN